jgi:hypothetical protein
MSMTDANFLTESVGEVVVATRRCDDVLELVLFDLWSVLSNQSLWILVHIRLQITNFLREASEIL